MGQENYGSGFEKGSGCYTCKACGKKTLETGDCESDVGMCFECYERSGWENIHSDGSHGENNRDPNCPICAEERTTT